MIDFALSELPQKLYVRDILSIKYTDIESIPGDIEAYLLEVSSYVSIIPDSPKIRAVDISKNDDIKILPNQNYVTIDAYQSALENLPDLSSLGDDNYRSAMVRLHEMFPTTDGVDPKSRCNHHLAVSCSYGSYDLRESNIKRFPERLRIIYGNLNVGGNSLQYLTDELTVDGHLTIWASFENFRKIAKILRVAGTLQIQDNQCIEELPATVEAGSIYLYNCHKYFRPPVYLKCEHVVIEHCHEEIVKDFRRLQKNNGFWLRIED